MSTIAIAVSATRSPNCQNRNCNRARFAVPTVPLPADDFYADWTLAQFGSEVGSQAAAIFCRIDCHMPQPTDWTNGPGGIKPDP
ncbi:MAG: hypothetical protein ACXWO1_19020 [Isosphaeraceae bacterium]